MPNQNITNHLRENKDKFPKETLISELRKAGYGEGEIEEGVGVFKKKSWLRRFLFNPEKPYLTAVRIGALVATVNVLQGVLSIRLMNAGVPVLILQIFATIVDIVIIMSAVIYFFEILSSELFVYRKIVTIVVALVSFAAGFLVVLNLIDLLL